MKILFFIESLWTGGTQRRLIELIAYLKQHTDFEIALVLTEDEIHFEKVYELGITIKVIKRIGIKYDPNLIFKFCRYCRLFKPDIIHTWGIMTTFYAIPAKLICKVPLITSMIADSKKRFKTFSLYNIFFKTNLYFSDVILSNSKAGLHAYNLNSTKAKVIYNGVRLERFQQNHNQKEVRDLHVIKTTFMIVMVASFSKFKDYDLFLDVARELGEIRNDVTFVGVGDGTEFKHIQQRIFNEQIERVILTGSRMDVESIVAASDIGILFTNIELHGEGISNSIIEYMALGKPVITTDIYGGSKEIIIEGKTGYCIDRSSEKIADLINSLLNNEVLRISMGEKGKKQIASLFSIDRMGKEFEIVYKNLIGITDTNRKKK